MFDLELELKHQWLSSRWEKCIVMWCKWWSGWEKCIVMWIMLDTVNVPLSGQHHRPGGIVQLSCCGKGVLGKQKTAQRSLKPEWAHSRQCEHPSQFSSGVNARRMSDKRQVGMSQRAFDGILSRSALTTGHYRTTVKTLIKEIATTLEHRSWCWWGKLTWRWISFWSGCFSLFLKLSVFRRKRGFRRQCWKSVTWHCFREPVG